MEFARSKSVAIQGTVLGTGVLGLACAGVYGAFKGSVAMARAYRRLPRWLQVLLPVVTLGATALVAFHSPTRARVRDLVRRAKPWLAEVRERGGDLLDQYLEEMQEADGRAQAALALIREQVPIPSRRPTLKQLA